MKLRLLINRLRRSVNLTLLRLTGLVLAVALAASVPAFVVASMERVLHQQMGAMDDPLAVVVNWRAADEGNYDQQVAVLDRYLREAWPAQAGLSGAPVHSLRATAQAAVQKYGTGTTLLAGKRYLTLAALPDGLTASAGRLPEPGKAEVAVPESMVNRFGYAIGSKLRVPVPNGPEVLNLDLTVVGSIRLPTDGGLSHLSGVIDGALLTSPDYWASLQVATGEVTWAILPDPAELHAAEIGALLNALADLPLRASQRLATAEVVASPLTWVAQFAKQMEATERFLLVLLTPVFLLVLFFVVATANVLVDSRRTEVAVLRSRGATPLQVIGHYLPESGLLALTATVLGVVLTIPLVKLMGLTAGFLQLVGRPALPVTLTAATLLYGLAAALLAEAAALWPLVQVVRFTVATIRQEAVTRSPVLAALQAVGEVALLAVLAYGTWRLRATGSGGDPLYLALPALFLAGAGLLMLRLFRLLAAILHRGFGPRMRPALALAAGWLHSQSSRYRALSLMLVITLGLGIYGAAFARTLDRDLTARAQYRVGSDLLLQPTWESEVLEVDSAGNPTEIAYREPPYSDLQNLPGVAAQTRVQTRKGVTLSAANRNLGKADLLGIEPREFGLTARFLTELTAMAPQALEALAHEEQAILLSKELATRTRLKPGDRVRVKQGEIEIELIVVGIVAHWPGRLPEEGEFLVGNLHYLQDSLELAPYAVWLRMEPGAALAPLVDELKARQVRISAASDRRSAVAEGRRQPFRLGIYATLSAGFAVAILVMVLTYLLSVGLTLQARAKELGVLRAMGMEPGQVALSLYAEQLLMMGVAAATGLGSGALAAALYVPALRQQPGEILLPLKLASVTSEQASLLIAFALTLGLGAASVAIWMKRLDVQAVLRLGEDG